ncbi:MAG: hypothetical protein R2748_07970 [Bryobacterales bacterium]
MEVINAGGVSYASYRVAAVMEELAQYEPDAFLIYSGHNEFLERRTYEGLIETPAPVTALGGILSRTRIWAAGAKLTGAGPSARPTKSCSLRKSTRCSRTQWGRRTTPRRRVSRRCSSTTVNLRRMVEIARGRRRRS